jgi:hypothetical protein
MEIIIGLIIIGAVISVMSEDSADVVVKYDRDSSGRVTGKRVYRRK